MVMDCVVTDVDVGVGEALSLIVASTGAVGAWICPSPICVMMFMETTLARFRAPGAVVGEVAVAELVVDG